MTEPGARLNHQLQRILGYCYPALTLVLLLLLAHHHWQIISAAVPLDYYEGTQTLITGLFAAGNNPYTAAFQPMNAHVYPPLYNILVAPFTAIFDNSLLCC